MLRPDPSTLFKGVAYYYAHFRRPYPPDFFRDVVAYYGLDGTGRLVDLGCGTGEFTIPLSRHVEHAVGLDVSEDMLAEARARGERESTTNIRWLLGRAEDIDATVAPIRLTTSSAAVHWMDQSLILAKIHAMTTLGGGMVLVNDNSPVRGDEKTEAWKRKRQEIITKYLGPLRRAGDHFHREYIPVKRNADEVTREHIEQSPWRAFVFRMYPYVTRRNIDEIIGFLWSTSYANRRLLGDQVDAFEQEMREELLALVPSGIFEEEGAVRAFFLRKA